MPPDDTDPVLKAIRLGWYVAEVRGRNRLVPLTWDDSTPFERGASDLPLRIERKPREQRIEAQEVVALLASDLGVDNKAGVSDSFSKQIDDKAKRLYDATDDAARTTYSREVVECIFIFDAHIQDVLSAKSDTQACGYQLGRGLSEALWDLDLKAEANRWTSWDHLLGQRRCNELVRL